LKKLITLVGPTASGKTSLAIRLAKRIGGEIISLDSRQIYKGMSIGTAQPNKKEMEEVKHHLVSCLNPSDFISSGRYADLVEKKIYEIKKKNKIPILCGGAGLYYRAIQKGIFEGSISNFEIRDKLEKQYQKNPEILFKRLKKIDKEYAKIVHINNKKRLIRAMEIYECTGKSPTENFKLQYYTSSKAINMFTILLKWERITLNRRIKIRTSEMFKKGWIKEVKNLLKLQLEQNKKFHPLNSIGYKHIKRFLDNEISEAEMLKTIYIRTRQLARRQEKWFKKEPVDLYIMMDSLREEKIYKILDCFLKRII
tara:strand:+ start:2127 stop:3059 length:933 start_codon:yes stop_codon:yes gene_type:complete